MAIKGSSWLCGLCVSRHMVVSGVQEGGGEKGRSGMRRGGSRVGKDRKGVGRGREEWEKKKTYIFKG